MIRYMAKTMMRKDLNCIHCTGMGVFFTLFLNACAVGPDYKQPETQLPDSFANGNHAEYSAEKTEQSWWKLFNDQQLIEIVVGPCNIITKSRLRAVI